ncbi:MAG: hypothetical protein J6M12_05485 [Clostridia bacterium]|nr:hypothetical protein [Clostridia bacterium]
MKKILCLTLTLLFALPLLAGCNDASFLTDPAGESESAAASAPSVIEEERESPSPIPSPAPQKSPTPSPKPLYPELPLPAEQILWSVSDFHSDAVFMFGKLMGLPSVQDVRNPEEVSDDQCVAFSLSYSHNDAHQLPEGFKETLEQKGFAVHKSKNPDQLFLFVTRKQVNEAEFTEEELQSIWLEFIREEYYRQNVAPVGYEN